LSFGLGVLFLCSLKNSLVYVLSKLREKSSYYTYFKIINSLIIHEENTKKNHKRVVSLYVIEVSLYLHKLFNFDFLDLCTTYFLKITSLMNLLDRSFLKQFKTFAVRVLSDLKILGFASYLYIWQNTCCSCFK
jgi:hypothetical protein